MAVTTTLLLSLLMLQYQVLAQESGQCTADNSAKIRFSVSSRRNETGHRLVGVKILNNADAAREQTVDVEQATLWCNGSEMTITTAEAEVRFRRPDYELFSGLGYYKIHIKPQIWEQAKLTCLQEGAHLLVVDSEGEAELVKQFFTSKPNIQGATHTEYIFIGVSDRAVEGQYVTVLGQPLSPSGYAKWYSGQPDNSPRCTEPESDCMIMYGKDGSLWDEGCLCKFAFICEQEL